MWIDEFRTSKIQFRLYEMMLQRLSVNSAYSWIEKGNILFNQSKYDEAIRCYDNALKIYPDREAIFALFKTNISNGAIRQ